MCFLYRRGQHLSRLSVLKCWHSAIICTLNCTPCCTLYTYLHTHLQVLLNLSKISATVHIAVPVLEFLSTLISLPQVLCNVQFSTVSTMIYRCYLDIYSVQYTLIPYTLQWDTLQCNYKTLYTSLRYLPASVLSSSSLYLPSPCPTPTHSRWHSSKLNNLLDLLHPTTPYSTLLFLNSPYYIVYPTMLYCTLLNPTCPTTPFYTLPRLTSPFYTLPCSTMLYCTLLHPSTPYQALLQTTKPYYTAHSSFPCSSTTTRCPWPITWSSCGSSSAASPTGKSSSSLSSRYSLLLWTLNWIV